MRLPFLISLFAFAIGSPSIISAEEAVLVNGTSAITTISEDELKDYYLGKKANWPDGSKVTVVVLKDGASHESLMKKLGKSTSQFSTGWKKLVFTGKGSMPEQVGSEDELVAFVAKNPGSIGYADVGKVKDGVKAVSAK